MTPGAQLLPQLEWLAAGLGLINIVLLVRRSPWNFLFGILSVATYIVIFYASRLYAESLLQVFFVAANIWGWAMWHRATPENQALPVGWLPPFARWTWAMATAAISLGLGLIMHRYTNAVMPFADAAIAGASVAAQLLLGLRRIENWVLWIMVDMLAIALYIDRALYPTAVLYTVMLAMSVAGLREWTAAHRREQQP